MPFPMVHFHTAKSFIDSGLKRIDDIPQFFIGVLAPDAIMQRNGYTYEDKKRTHFIQTENQFIRDKALSYITDKREENPSFYLGYAVHLLTDDAWEKTLSVTFTQRIVKLIGDDRFSAIRPYYLSEMSRLDVLLYHMHSYLHKILDEIALAEIFAGDELVTNQELKGEIDYTTAWYLKHTTGETKSEIVTLEEIENFCLCAAKRIQIG